MAGNYPEGLERLAELLSQLPGIGRRTAERLAVSLIDWDPMELEQLGNQIRMLPELVHICEHCGNLADESACRICLDETRDRQIICVVENARQIPVIERTGRHRGLYHVLGGRLAPLDGVDIADLNVDSLYNRIQEHDVTEIILATSPDVEGEATATYLAEELRRQFEVVLSRIALGVPVGSDLTYADAATMAMAIDSRRKM